MTENALSDNVFAEAARIELTSQESPQRSDDLACQVLDRAAYGFMRPVAYIDPAIDLNGAMIRLAAPNLHSNNLDKDKGWVEVPVDSEASRAIRKQLQEITGAPQSAGTVLKVSNLWTPEVLGDDAFEYVKQKFPQRKVFVGPGIVVDIDAPNESPLIAFPAYTVSQEDYCNYPDSFEHKGRTIPGLVDSAISRLLEDRARFLFKKWALRSGSPPFEPHEHMHRAGYHLLDAIQKAAGEALQGMLFSACHEISRSPYEGSVCQGAVLIAPEEADLDYTMQFTNERYDLVGGAEGISLRLMDAAEDHPGTREPLSIRNHRSIRKLLEMAADDLFLVTNGDHVFGLARASSDELSSRFTIRFRGHSFWDVRFGHSALMEVRSGRVFAPQPTLDTDAFRKTLQATFSDTSTDITQEAMELLVGVAKSASRSSSGMMVVISQDAAKEARKLQQCRRIEPRVLSDEVLRIAGRVDGAIIIDMDARCHAIGVILDGKRCTEEDSTRGARYNSAVRYVHSNRKSLAIVLSDDGMFDIIAPTGAESSDSHEDS